MMIITAQQYICVSENLQGGVESIAYSFLSTDDKNKIKVGEPNCPLSAVTRGKRVLVAKGQVLKSSDHDFSTLSLTPTVVLLHDIPFAVDNSWYRGTPYIYVKIHATEPSTALRNVREVADVLIQHFGSNDKVPPIPLTVIQSIAPITYRLTLH